MQDGQQPGWVFKPGEQSPVPQDIPAAQPDTASGPAPAPESTPEPTDGMQVEWSASEYVANPKSPGWFGVLALGTVLLAAVVLIITRDVISTMVVVIAGILFGVFAARQPRTLEYAIDNSGIHAGAKFYPYAMFKSFSLAQDHAVASITLIPLKRFMPPLVVHYAPEDEDRIANTLADYLPYENHTDIMDKIAKKIRF